MRRAISESEARLLEATVAVREAIDRECGPNGTFTSEDPEYARKTALFDDLHAEEAAAWVALKQERAADADEQRAMHDSQGAELGPLYSPAEVFSSRPGVFEASRRCNRCGVVLTGMVADSRELALAFLRGETISHGKKLHRGHSV